MSNLEKLESVKKEIISLSNEQRIEFLSYLTGALGVYFEHKKVSEKTVLQSYLHALELVKATDNR